MAVFVITVLTVWTSVHAYVLWRVWRLPAVNTPLAHRVLVVAALFLWMSYPSPVSSITGG
jgi:hypothetical protein